MMHNYPLKLPWWVDPHWPSLPLLFLLDTFSASPTPWGGRCSTSPRRRCPNLKPTAATAARRRRRVKRSGRQQSEKEEVLVCCCFFAVLAFIGVQWFSQFTAIFFWGLFKMIIFFLLFACVRVCHCLFSKFVQQTF